MDGYLLRCSKNLDIYMERNIYNVKVMATRFNEGDVKVYIKRFGVRLREQCPSYRILMKHYYISVYNRFKIINFAKQKSQPMNVGLAFYMPLNL